jgi:hypothetical protein
VVVRLRSVAMVVPPCVALGAALRFAAGTVAHIMAAARSLLAWQSAPSQGPRPHPRTIAAIRIIVRRHTRPHVRMNRGVTRLETRRYSDTLAMFILKSKRREVWGERQEIQVKDDWALLSIEERERRALKLLDMWDEIKERRARGNACGPRGRRRLSTTQPMATNWPPAKPRNVPGRKIRPRRRYWSLSIPHRIPQATSGEGPFKAPAHPRGSRAAATTRSKRSGGFFHGASDGFVGEVRGRSTSRASASRSLRGSSPFSPGGGNRPSCPNPALAVGWRQRLNRVQAVWKQREIASWPIPSRENRL